MIKITHTYAAYEVRRRCYEGYHRGSQSGLEGLVSAIRVDIRLGPQLLSLLNTIQCCRRCAKRVTKKNQDGYQEGGVVGFGRIN